MAAAFTLVPSVDILTVEDIRSAADRQQWTAAARAGKQGAEQHTNSDSSLNFGSSIVQQLHTHGSMNKERAFAFMQTVLPLFFIQAMMEAPPATANAAGHRQKKQQNKTVWGAESFTAFLDKCIQWYVDREQRARADQGTLSVVHPPKVLKAVTIFGHMAAVQFYAHNLTLPEEQQVWNVCVSGATKLWQCYKKLEGQDNRRSRLWQKLVDRADEAPSRSPTLETIKTLVREFPETEEAVDGRAAARAQARQAAQAAAAAAAAAQQQEQDRDRLEQQRQQQQQREQELRQQEEDTRRDIEQQQEYARQRAAGRQQQQQLGTEAGGSEDAGLQDDIEADQVMQGQHEDSDELTRTLDEEDDAGQPNKRARTATAVSMAQVCGLLQTEQQGAASLQRTLRCMMAALFITWPDAAPADLADKAWHSLLPPAVQQAATPHEVLTSGCSSGPGSAQQLFADLVQTELGNCIAVLLSVMEAGCSSRAKQCSDARMQPWGAADIERLRVGGLLEREVAVQDVGADVGEDPETADQL